MFPEGTTDQLRSWPVTPQMPHSTYNNPYVQALVTKLTATDVSAGEAPLRTGVNGIRYRTDVAYGMIDSDVICNEPPRVLSSAELADFASITRDFDLSEVRLTIKGGDMEVPILDSGAPIFQDERAVEVVRMAMDNKEVAIVVDLGVGNESATGWGCDLTYDYVRINAEYAS